MKKSFAVLFVAVFGVLASLPASARVNWVIGLNFGYPYYSPYYYPAPVYVVPQPQVIYVQPAPQPAAPVSNDLYYYCKSAKMYYPYARECPEGWERVPAQPH